MANDPSPNAPKTSSETIQLLRGLTPAEVEASRAEHGANALTPPAREPWWKLYFEKFKDPIIQILLMAAAVAIIAGLADGHYIEGIGIICAIFLSTFLAFINEYSAGKQFDVLNQVSDDVGVKVLRGNAYASVPRKEVVVGDIVLLDAGEEIPADGDVLESVSLLVEESRLTGESEPVEKVSLNTQQTSTEHSEGNAYPPTKVLRSTLVSGGRGTLRITAVGDKTEVGQTQRAAMESTDHEKTPLNRQLETLSKRIGVVGFSVSLIQMILLTVRGKVSGELVLSAVQWQFAALTFLALQLALMRVWVPVLRDGLEWMGFSEEHTSWLKKIGELSWIKAVIGGALLFALSTGLLIALGNLPKEYQQWMPAAATRQLLAYFMIAVTLVVVSVPEGLSMSVTLSLAYSMKKMAAANNLVRRMHACETIGAASVICSDKTGTLTLGEMRAHDAHFPSLLAAKANGKFSEGSSFQFIAESISANTTANLAKESGKPAGALGNPTEGALLLWLDAQGSDYLKSRNAFQTSKQWSFATERKFMATLGRSGVRNENILHAKGAPEILLARCTAILDEKGERPLGAERAEIETALKNAQSKALRTLGFAYRKYDDSVKADGVNLDTLNDLVWLGFMEIADPVRPEVPGAIQACNRAGIQVKIVTGDNHRTALEIARQIGLRGADDSAGTHMTGPEFEKMSDAELSTRIGALKVLSRARPMDKLRLVRLLQAKGEVVAVTGDGSNDAPALNHADVGLSMGKSGTAVAREASDIILLDDSFESIARAVMWGRSLYENIQRFIVFQLTVNFVALGIALLGPFIGVQMPLTVVQMLWVNLIMDTFAALALASEPPRESVMNNPPRRPDAFIVTPAMARNIFLTGVVFLAAFCGVLLYHGDAASTPQSPAEKERVLTIFFCFFVLLQFWNLFNARRAGSSESALSGLMKNRALVIIAVTILVVQILIVQFGGSVFRTVPLSVTDWAYLIGGTSLVLVAGEFVRWIARLKKTAGK